MKVKTVWQVIEPRPEMFELETRVHLGDERVYHWQGPVMIGQDGETAIPTMKLKKVEGGPMPLEQQTRVMKPGMPTSNARPIPHEVVGNAVRACYLRSHEMYRREEQDPVEETRELLREIVQEGPRESWV